VLRIAINGYGRIGRSFLRAVYESKAREMLQVVAINEPADAKTIAYLTRYDSTHGRFPGTVGLQGLSLRINGDSINLLAVQDILGLPWRDLDVDVVLECSGTFSDRRSAEQHIQSGAQRVLFSQPAQPDVDQTIVFGVNQNELNGSETIISAASCTTNAIVPVLKVINDHYGIDGGHIETVHSYTNDQNLIDNFHKGDRRGRGAPLNMVITSTGAVEAVSKAIPELADKLTGNAIRVPTPNVSLAILSLVLNVNVDKDDINNYLKSMAFHSKYRETLGFVNSPEIVSTDFYSSPFASIIDSQATITSGKRVTLYCWYDNEYGYSKQVINLAKKIAGISLQRLPKPIS